MLEAGAKLPVLTVVDDTGTSLSTKNLLGKHLVLFFYPKADTPG